MKKAVIIEDELMTAQNLKEQLMQVAPEYSIVAMLQGVEDSVEWFKGNEDYQLVFMDIHLADGEAFEIFDEVNVNSPIIFTTAYDQYAIKAFKVNSVDYLLKPIALDDLRRAIEKLHRMHENSVQQTEGGLTEEMLALLQRQMGYYSRRLLVNMGNRLVLLNVQDIAYIVVGDNQLTAVDFHEKQYPLEGSMELMAEKLNPNDFFRANRQYIIAKTAVKEVQFWFGSKLDVKLTVPTTERIIVSRNKAKEFKQWLSE